MLRGPEEMAYIPALVDRLRFLLSFFETLRDSSFWPWVLPVSVSVIAIYLLIRSKRD